MVVVNGRLYTSGVISSRSSFASAFDATTGQLLFINKIKTNVVNPRKGNWGPLIH